MELTTAQRRDLRARAHGLHAVVSVSQHGLTEPVLAEIDRSLKAHELIKVRVYGEDRGTRDALMIDICTRLAAAPVQHIGSLLVIFRANPEVRKPAPALKTATKATLKTPTKAPIKTGVKARVKADVSKFNRTTKSTQSVRSVKSARPTDPRRRSRI